MERRSALENLEDREFRQEFFDDFSQLPPAENEAEDGLTIGVQVRHPTFGIGVVKRSEGRGERQKVTVYFHSGVVKTLMVKFAGLQSL